MEKITLSSESKVERCQALDLDGKQCKNKGTKTVKYHGDHNIYSSFYSDEYPITWVKIKICKQHKEENTFN